MYAGKAGAYPSETPFRCHSRVGSEGFQICDYFCSFIGLSYVHCFDFSLNISLLSLGSRNKLARAIFPGKPFKPSLLFDGKAIAEPFRFSTLGEAPCLAHRH